MAGAWRLAIGLLPLVAATLPDENITEDCSGERDIFDGQVHVYLTLSALAETFLDGRIQQRLIELNWVNGGSIADDADVDTDDLIGLYDHDPSANDSQPLLQISALEHDGYFRTNIQFDPSIRPNVSEHSDGGNSCLGYWIGYIRNGSVIATNCLQMQPSWMWQNREQLGPMELRKLFLPGTHNSGSYRPYTGHHSDTVFTRYLVCQDEDIKTQLNYGIRYLDIRVGYYPDQPEGFQFWLNHNYAKINPLFHLIEDVAAFLKTNREVLVVDFHRFPKGFDNHPEAHGLLVDYLYRHWGDLMAPSSMRADATVNEFWAANKTLIVAYSDDNTRITRPFLWPNIPQEWGDKRSVEGLYSFLKSANERHANDAYVWAAMAELTPSAMDIIFRPQGGLRRLAQLTNANVTHWYQHHQFWPKANSVAVDFFHGTDIVDIAIRANLRRAACSNLI